MEDEQDPLSGLVIDDGSEYELDDVSEEEEEGEDLHHTDEDQDAGTQEGDDQFGADAEEALLRAQVNTSHFTTPVGMSPAQNELGYGCVRAPSATSIRSTRIGLEFLMYHAGIQGLLRPVFGVLLHVDSFLHYSFVASHGSEGTRRLSTCIDLWGRFLSCCETQSFCEARRILRVSQHEPLLFFMAQDIKRGGPDQPTTSTQMSRLQVSSIFGFWSMPTEDLLFLPSDSN